MPQNSGLQQTQGNGSATNAGATTSIIAGQTGKILRIRAGCISVYLAATGGGGIARLCDGTTTVMQWPGDALGGYAFDFGEVGYPLTSGNALQLIVSGAVTTQASAYLSAVAWVC